MNIVVLEMIMLLKKIKKVRKVTFVFFQLRRHYFRKNVNYVDSIFAYLVNPDPNNVK